MQASATFKAQNHPNGPGTEAFESGGSSSSGTWVASEACEGSSSGSGGSSGSDEHVDCDPGSLRLRSLLQAADRARSTSASSSFCGEESESEIEIEIDSEETEKPPRFVARAASARSFMDRARASSGDLAVAAVASGAFGRDKASVAAGQDDDAEGAAALAAALEAVLLCPPQILARSSSCQGATSFLSSLLTPTSDRSDRGGDSPRGAGGAAGGDGGGKEDKDDNAAAEDAVKAALAWSFSVPKLSRVAEESGVAAGVAGIVTSSAPGSRSKGMPDAADFAEHCCASDSAVALAGHREGFAVIHSDHDACSRGSGEENGGHPPLAVRSDGTRTGGGKVRRRASRTSEPSGDRDADTLPPSPVVPGLLNARTPSNVCTAASSSAASHEAAVANYDGSRSSDVSTTVAQTEAAGGFGGCDISPERSTTTGNACSKSAADDDDSGSVGGGGGGGSGGSSSDNGSNRVQRPRWGSLNMAEFPSEDAPPSAAAVALGREKVLLSVFGQHAGAAELATVGRSNSCHVFLEAASRIAALPPFERSLLAELDRSSDDEGGGIGSESSSDSSSDSGFGGDGARRDVAPWRQAKEEVPSAEGAVAATASLVNRKLTLLRVGCAEAGRDGVATPAASAAAPTTAYRYRRLAGNSGRGWPPRVDPTRREEWLCPIEFEAVFGMKFAEFKELPSWKRIILKQEVHLF